MDDLDLKILKEIGSPNSLQWNVRVTYSSVAEKIGVDEETVRRRMKRAEKLGSFPGWKMMPNPYLIGCEATSLHLEVEDEAEKDKAISEIRRVDGVIKILNFRGKELQATLYYPNTESLRRKVDLIRSISGSLEPTVWKLGFPQPDIKMTQTDWQIIKNMLDDARKSLDNVSKSVGVSTRTVERRLNLLSRGQAVYLQGTPVFRKHAGLSCVFLVHCPDPKKKQMIDRTVLAKVRRLDLANTSPDQYSNFVTVYDNLSEADDTTRWIRSLDGVETVTMNIMKELIIEQSWLGDEIERRLSMS